MLVVPDLHRKAVIFSLNFAILMLNITAYFYLLRNLLFFSWFLFQFLCSIFQWSCVSCFFWGYFGFFLSRFSSLRGYFFSCIFWFFFCLRCSAFQASSFASNTLPIGLGSPVNSVFKPLFSMIWRRSSKRSW